MSELADSRVHPRAKAQIKVEYHYGTTTGIGHSDDISEGGLFLLCDRPAAKGTRIYLRLHLPGSRSGDPLKLIGVVTRATGRIGLVESDPHMGMAIKFQVAYSRTKQELHDFMDLLLVEAADQNVDHLDGGEHGSAYVARFPHLEGYERATTLPPQDLDAAFSFTPAPPQTQVRFRFLGETTIKLAVLLLALALVGYFVSQYAGFFAGAR
ncbi:MAG: PilZ domain-containing protein [Polyangiaceae bacterium]